MTLENIDKDSVEYFMKLMTQKEFSGRTQAVKYFLNLPEYKYNKIRKALAENINKSDKANEH